MAARTAHTTKQQPRDRKGRFAPTGRPAPDLPPQSAPLLVQSDRARPADRLGLLAAASAPAEPLCRRFSDYGFRLWVVGGTVRDALLGLEPHDLDCTTDANPTQIRAVVNGDPSATIWGLGEKFGTVCCSTGGAVFEITAHRTERYDDMSRKPEVEFGDSLEEDLARRDFTINAIAYDPLTGELADPYDGQADLRRKVLRAPKEARSAFSADPLRMLRAGRFLAAYGLEADPVLADAAASMSERLSIVSTERVYAETERLLMLEDPGPGISFLGATGLLAKSVPGLESADIGLLSKSVSAAPGEPAAKWAAALSQQPHDVAKASLRALRADTQTIKDTARLLRADETMRAKQPSSDPEIRRAVLAGLSEPGALSYMRSARAARGQSCADIDEFERRVARLGSEEDLSDLGPPVDGREVMQTLGIGPGPEVGDALAHLSRLRLDRGPLSSAEAVDELRRWAT